VLSFLGNDGLVLLLAWLCLRPGRWVRWAAVALLVCHGVAAVLNLVSLIFHLTLALVLAIPPARAPSGGPS
jgi:hypothetical protein